ncbi:BTB/POZ domain, partial [Arabidopsis thaliana x Arabidopsis arenosa]
MYDLEQGMEPISPLTNLSWAARSKVFWNILDSDDCNDSSIKIYVLSDMTTYDELKTFLEFIYSGSLPDTIPLEHFRTLYVGAKEYEIPYLQEVCRNHLIASMNSSDAFDVLELAEIHSDRILKDAISEFITTNMKDTLFSTKFMSFVERNPALAVTTIRAYVNKIDDDRRRTHNTSGEDP